MASLGAALVASAIGVTLALDSGEAAASELERFSSCVELSRWTPAPEIVFTGADTTVAAGRSTAAAGAEDAAVDTPTAGAPATGQTNVVVAGVDELDVIDRIDEGHALVVTSGRLSLVDLGVGTVLATLGAPVDARLTYDPDAAVAWVVGNADAGGTVVQRVAVGAAALSLEGEWRTTGWLVDARRTGDRLHVVASEGFGPGGAAVPFEDGPVPCDQVMHPPTPSGPEATLLVTLPAAGEVSPVHAAEVVGSGQLVHVTDEAAFLATPLWDGDEPQTTIHRFDLDTLTHTGSGRVPGMLLNPFSMSEYDNHLRVALTRQGGFFRGGTGHHRRRTRRAGRRRRLAPRPPRPCRSTGWPAPEPDAGEPLNEIVVLDLDGDLDVVGRTPRFGHPGETLQGVRFDGPRAYAVTYLQTDPFYVVDLADPADPRLAGEVELPGFSAYLHPVGDGLVAGFGPDADGRAAVKLFDVSDPARPRVTDSEVLGDDSPVTADHHAFLDLGNGRFAVPATTWRAADVAGCSAAVRDERLAGAADLEEQLGFLYQQVPVPQAAVDRLSRQVEAVYADPCLYPPMVADTDVVVAATGGGGIDVDLRLTVESAVPGSRVLQVGDRWAVLAGAHLLTVAPGGGVTDLALG